MVLSLCSFRAKTNMETVTAGFDITSMVLAICVAVLVIALVFVLFLQGDKRDS